ncbi:MAG: dihydroorotase [Clostridia bacterium]|nr:dihydroorotase [Clostridia bacterium]
MAVISPVYPGFFPKKAQSLLSLLPSSYEYVLIPGFCDVHVHFREPGFSYKETIFSGCRAAAHGGYTDVCTMPNVNPVPDSLARLKEQQTLIDRDACVHVHPYGAITVDEKGEVLADMAALAPYVVAFSDDGRGVQSREKMKEAFVRAKALNKLIAAHCEDNTLLRGGYVHDGVYAHTRKHKGICSESEWKQLERDLLLAKETGCGYHVCHISCKESVDLIRQAKKDGIDVSCETAPHYLTLDENDLQEDGRFKMNPPLRAREDRLALIEGVCDGTIDMIATDHAPHAEEEKAKGLAGSAFGIVGLETAFSVLYTRLVKENVLTLKKLIDLLAFAPRRRFSLPETEDFSLWRLDETFQVEPARFLSRGRATPYAGETLCGVCYLTVCDNKIVYQAKQEEK